MFTVDRAQGTLNAHRGPFLFCLCRPHVKKPGFFTSEWLKGNTSKEDVIAEARALLTDPRDTITGVSVWSETEQQHVYSFRRKDFDA